MQSLFDITNKLRTIMSDLVEPNKCLYCKKNTTDNIDSNVLCSQCYFIYFNQYFCDIIIIEGVYVWERKVK